MANQHSRLRREIDEPAALADARAGMSNDELRRKYAIGWGRARDLLVVAGKVLPVRVDSPVSDSDLPTGGFPKVADCMFYPAEDSADWEISLTLTPTDADRVLKTFSFDEILASFALSDKMSLIAQLYQQRIANLAMLPNPAPLTPQE